MIEQKVLWRLELHARLVDHPFIQDPDDIPGGCLTCWNRVAEEEE